MSFNKNLVISINNVEEEKVVDIRTTDDGSICIDPKADKIVVSECDLDCAINELKKFNADNKTKAETQTIKEALGV